MKSPKYTYRQNFHCDVNFYSLLSNDMPLNKCYRHFKKKQRVVVGQITLPSDRNLLKKVSS